MERKSNYISMGVTAFLTAAAILLFYDTLFGGKAVLDLLKTVQPILYGAFIAYLLAPMVNFFERGLFPLRPGRERKRSQAMLVRTAGILLAWLVIAFFFYLLASVLLPELYKSVLQLIANVDNYYNTISGWVNHLLETNPAVSGWVSQQMAAYFQDLDKWLTGGVLPQLQAVMVTVSGGVLSLVNFVKDLLVGIIASVYLLATKERCAAYGRKLVYSLVPRERVGLVLRGVRRADLIFSGFVRGKLLDSIIIGVLCFVCCSILKFPYTPLVSVFVGVTNIIPFFGPFLGAIPSAFLILLVSPRQALYFVIFVLALQQLDGNVIGPKILGNTTGLSSLWVIIAILVGGGFFGVVGMFFGVPVCACLNSLVNYFVDARLRKKGLSPDAGEYAAGGVHGPRPE
ncbi:AI-2E family transporter [uncultured Oscillibacter sp.]|jgi:predicted PurR-regulated permease PerM|uniref:AI-2E family transporter n=1 Tax=uncultured Oscillibacter sp. TaxID=876091 RepID=UPI00217351BE|nr:AI-2E family transporter [uncultured Oscillibacter sp.]MCI9554855.1 AI-2E family transporter [Oscillibacter sp.]